MYKLHGGACSSFTVFFFSGGGGGQNCAEIITWYLYSYTNCSCKTKTTTFSVQQHNKTKANLNKLVTKLDPPFLGLSLVWRQFYSSHWKHCLPPLLHLNVVKKLPSQPKLLLAPCSEGKCSFGTLKSLTSPRLIKILALSKANSRQREITWRNWQHCWAWGGNKRN